MPASFIFHLLRFGWFIIHTLPKRRHEGRVSPGRPAWLKYRARPPWPLPPESRSGTLAAAAQDRKILGSVHGGHADRLRHPPCGGRDAHDAAALSRRSL